MDQKNVVRISQKSPYERLTGLPDPINYADKDWDPAELPVGHEVAAEFAKPGKHAAGGE